MFDVLVGILVVLPRIRDVDGVFGGAMAFGAIILGFMALMQIAIASNSRSGSPGNSLTMTRAWYFMRNAVYIMAMIFLIFPIMGVFMSREAISATSGNFPLVLLQAHLPFFFAMISLGISHFVGRRLNSLEQLEPGNNYQQ